MDNLIASVKRMESQREERSKKDTPEAFRRKFAEIYGPGAKAGKKPPKPPKPPEGDDPQGPGDLPDDASLPDEAQDAPGGRQEAAGERGAGQAGEDTPTGADAPQGQEAGSGRKPQKPTRKRPSRAKAKKPAAKGGV